VFFFFFFHPFFFCIGIDVLFSYLIILLELQVFSFPRFLTSLHLVVLLLLALVLAMLFDILGRLVLIASGGHAHTS